MINIYHGASRLLRQHWRMTTHQLVIAVDLKGLCLCERVIYHVAHKPDAHARNKPLLMHVLYIPARGIDIDMEGND